MSRPSDPPPAPAAPAFPAGRNWPAGWVCALIFLLVVLAYLPALSGGFIWDDNGHVTRPDLRSLAGLGRIWFEIGATQQYYPLLHSAFWLEHLVWGDAPLGYHLLNILLHTSAACLLGLLLRRLAVPGAWLAALLFALHPVCVESVAWISEQKNTLAAVLYLGAALAYLRFDGSREAKPYALATGLFILALLTKTVTATLPAALLVVFWWRRGRLDWRREVVPLLPWLALGAASGLFTAHFEREMIGAQGADFALTALQRGLLAGRVFWFYLGKLAWPADLIFIYPRWTVDAAVWWQWIFPLAGLALLAALLWWSRRSRGPLAAALLFSGTLFPVLGFVNVYPFVFSFVADHFQYLSSPAIFALVAAGLAQATIRLPASARYGAAGTLLAILGVLSWSQGGMYRNVFTLYQTTLARNPSCWMAHNNLAIALSADGRIEEAIAHLEQSLRLKPDYAIAENNLGDNLVKLDRPVAAVPHFDRAVRLQPNYAVAHRNLGLALAMSGRTAEALPHFQEAVRLDPSDADAELKWATGLMLTGRFPEAVPHFERAIALAPESIDCWFTYGRALLRAGRFENAIPQFERAVRLAPDNAEAHRNLALTLRQLGRKEEASAHYLEALRLNPGLADPR